MAAKFETLDEQIEEGTQAAFAMFDLMGPDRASRLAHKMHARGLRETMVKHPDDEIQATAICVCVVYDMWKKQRGALAAGE